MKIDFEFDTAHGKFRDALHLPDNHGLSDAEIEAMKEQRRNNNEALSYGNWVVIGIAVGIISSLIGVIFNGLLYNYIYPTLPETIRELTLEKTLGMMESMGASEETIEQAMGNMDERQFQQDLRASFTALLISSLFSAFVALIVAAFVKKEAPLFEEEA